MVVRFLKPSARWWEREQRLELCSWLREREQRVWELELEYRASANLYGLWLKIFVFEETSHHF